MKLPKLTTSGKNETVLVSDALFAAPVNKQVLAQAIRVYRSNQRQGTSKVQTRSEVSRTKSKWYRQKGTGNARHGSRNAHIFVGGGVVHGPNGEQNWNRALPAKLRSLALAHALTLQAENTKVLDALAELTGKTKEAHAAMVNAVTPEQKVLVVLPNTQGSGVRALYNISQVRVVSARYVTALEILSADAILLHPEVLPVLEGRVGQTAQERTAPAKKTQASRTAAKAETTKTEKPEKKSATRKTKSTSVSKK